MRVKAVKVDQGILIPYQHGLKSIETDHLVLDIELLDDAPDNSSYEALDEIVGLCETSDAEASVKHDQRIYRN